MRYLPQTILKKIAFFLGALLLIPQLGTPPGLRAETRARQLRKEAAGVREEMKKKAEKVRSFTQEERDTLSSLNAVDLSLNHARKQVRISQTELRRLEKEIAENRSAAEALSRQIAETETYAVDRLVRLYKLEHLGQIHLLASARSLNDLFQRRKALERILMYDEQVLAKLEREKGTLRGVRVTLAGQKKEKETIDAEHRKQVRLLRHQKEQRRKLLANIRRKKSLARAALGALKNSAAQLSRTIRALESEPSEVKKGGFAAFKGLLNMPVKGKIRLFFGPHRNKEFGVMNFQSGINIEARRGDPVRSVAGGRIIYSSWFKGYGNMIIVDHGDHYYTLYAHTEELFRHKGDTVKTGEVLATVGDTGSMTGPGLHFEIRHHGTPIDPLKWLKKG
ncbi:hypothetical protein DENIS_4191 [Desulfonema ishimotonii]|uniref:M23ase beta-sheet core domain-containing protein n=1 Tax=Desulfonema ishimotonii TaxID=45657 RepID=A0A401G1T0_9BACT|nr:peptidoglycan DD-metalloendopeptidase family protein [Desulfonema ishimotonii]GBC63198.1 hypothetical protein DENIS_4191 [Desulfonema ishimotonii]